MAVIVPAAVLGRQLAAIFAAWGMPEAQRTTVVDVMLAADLAGIDSHGAAMMPLYGEFHRSGRLTVAPQVRTVNEGPATALLDGDGGLGHVPSTAAMQLAIAKARSTGLAAVAVRNSNHFGAAGAYAAMAAAGGLIGIATSAVYKPSIVPPGATEPRFGTNPLAFAAPAGRQPPFLLDMATSTAAIGKLKIAAMAGRRVPEGWAMDDQGRALTDPAAALRHKRLTPLGMSRLMGGHKGYGLAMMVEILSTTLSGAAYAPLRDRERPDAARYDVGHFFLALAPSAFRPAADFARDLDAMIETLRATPTAAAAEPIQVAGDPEYRSRAARQQAGIPLPSALVDDLRALAAEAGAPFLLAI